MKQFLVIVSLINAILAHTSDEVNLSEIHSMTDNNYVKLLNENEANLVYFYAEGSKNCKKMNEEIKKVYDYVQERKLNVLISRVDVTKEENVAVDFGVERIPILKFVRYKYKIKNDYELIQDLELDNLLDKDKILKGTSYINPNHKNNDLPSKGAIGLF